FIYCRVKLFVQLPESLFRKIFYTEAVLVANKSVPLEKLYLTGHVFCAHTSTPERTFVLWISVENCTIYVAVQPDRGSSQDLPLFCPSETVGASRSIEGHPT